MKRFKVIFNDRKLKTVYVTATRWDVDISEGFTYFFRDDVVVAGINSSSICSIVGVKDGKRS